MSTATTTQTGHITVPASVVKDVNRAVENALHGPAMAAFERSLRPMYSLLDSLAPQLKLYTDMRFQIEKILEFHDRVIPWMNEFARDAATAWTRPAQVRGLDEHLGAFRRRRILADLSAYVRLKALTRRNLTGNSPGRLVVARPQVARGPNNRRSIAVFNPPAGLLHA